MKKINALIQKIQLHAEQLNAFAPEISTATAGWHLTHALVVIDVIVEELKRSDPTEYTYTFNWKRVWIFTFHKIPRGISKAPKAVQPNNEITLASLHSLINRVQRKLSNIDHLPKKHFFKHPYFNHLNVRATIYFLQIHTNHHLAIVKDILKSTRKENNN